jgi:hypothetical protein
MNVEGVVGLPLRFAYTIWDPSIAVLGNEPEAKLSHCIGILKEEIVPCSPTLPFVPFLELNPRPLLPHRKEV